MNPGNTRPPEKKVDALVERINRRIARLLGKRGKTPLQPQETSNFAFGILIISVVLILWIMTGFYYLGENQYGVVLKNGKLLRVVKGIKVGFTEPYPFGDIIVIDASVSDFIDVASPSSGDFNVLSRDLTPFVVAAKFSYQVTDPELLFRSVMQKQLNLDNLATWMMQDGVHKYISQRLKSDILKSNLIVEAGEIKNAVNNNLSHVGIKVVKFSLTSLRVVMPPVTTSSMTESSTQPTTNITPVAAELVSSANQYRQNILAQTQVDINRFNQLLPLYKSNPRAVAEQMYYDTLADIPTSNLNLKYPLLNMNLSDLIALGQVRKESAISVTSPGVMRERHFDRSVNRERSLRMSYDDDDEN